MLLYNNFIRSLNSSTDISNFIVLIISVVIIIVYAKKDYSKIKIFKDARIRLHYHFHSPLHP